MGLADRIKAWFKGETKPTNAPRPTEANPTNRRAVKELEQFLVNRDGVEGFLEPATTVYPTTLLLVAGDGEYLRRPVGDGQRARKLCDKHHLPIYDAAKVGYPKRMRDYDRGVRRESIPLEDLPPWPDDDDQPPAPDGP